MQVERKKNIAILIMAVAIVILGFITFATSKELDKVRNDLTARDAQIQEMDTELGLSRSSLLEMSELNNKYKDEIDSFPDKLKGIINSYELKLLNRDRTIARLRNSVAGGKTEVIVKNDDAQTEPDQDRRPDGVAAISYKWTDQLERFTLEDPDIFTKNDENFSYNQYMSVKGHVLYGKDGRLQIRRIELKEVTPDGEDESGKQKFKDVEGGKLEIVDSKFEYSDLSKKEKQLSDVLHPRLIATVSGQIGVPELDNKIRPGIGIEIVNLGRYIDHANLGLNIQAFPNIENIPAGSLLNTRVGAGIDYTLLPPLFNTNVGIGASISTPSNNLLNEWYFGLDAVVYITN